MSVCRTWNVLGVAVGCLVVAAAAEAHDLKVFVGQLNASAGTRPTAYLSWGHVLPVDGMIDADSIETYSLLSPAGSVTPLKLEGTSLQANTLTLEDAGIYQVIAIRKPAVMTKVIDEQGRHRHHAGPKTSVTSGTVDHALRSRQFAKALIVTDPTIEKTVEPAGLPIEIVPVEAPVAWRSGGYLRYRVLFDGKPLDREEVRATYVGYSTDESWSHTTKTDHAGIATVKVTQPGQWVLKVRKQAPTQGETRREYDYESYQATLVLPIQP